MATTPAPRQTQYDIPKTLHGVPVRRSSDGKPVIARLRNYDRNTAPYANQAWIPQSIEDRVCLPVVSYDRQAYLEFKETEHKNIPELQPYRYTAAGPGKAEIGFPLVVVVLINDRAYYFVIPFVAAMEVMGVARNIWMGEFIDYEYVAVDCDKPDYEYAKALVINHDACRQYLCGDGNGFFVYDSQKVTESRPSLMKIATARATISQSTPLLAQEKLMLESQLSVVPSDMPQFELIKNRLARIDALGIEGASAAASRAPYPHPNIEEVLDKAEKATASLYIINQCETVVAQCVAVSNAFPAFADSRKAICAQKLAALGAFDALAEKFKTQEYAENYNYELEIRMYEAMGRNAGVNARLAWLYQNYIDTLDKCQVRAKAFSKTHEEYGKRIPVAATWGADEDMLPLFIRMSNLATEALKTISAYESATEDSLKAENSFNEYLLQNTGTNNIRAWIAYFTWVVSMTSESRDIVRVRYPYDRRCISPIELFQSPRGSGWVWHYVHHFFPMYKSDAKDGWPSLLVGGAQQLLDVMEIEMFFGLVTPEDDSYGFVKPDGHLFQLGMVVRQNSTLSHILAVYYAFALERRKQYLANRIKDPAERARARESEEHEWRAVADIFSYVRNLPPRPADLVGRDGTLIGRHEIFNYAKLVPRDIYERSKLASLILSAGPDALVQDYRMAYIDEHYELDELRS